MSTGVVGKGMKNLLWRKINHMCVRNPIKGEFSELYSSKNIQSAGSQDCGGSHAASRPIFALLSSERGRGLVRVAVRSEGKLAVCIRSEKDTLPPLAVHSVSSVC